MDHVHIRAFLDQCLDLFVFSFANPSAMIANAPEDHACRFILIVFDELWEFDIHIMPGVWACEIHIITASGHDRRATAIRPLEAAHR